MHRIDHATAAPGNLFTEGNPATATPATTVTDDWLNDVQGNICDVVETAGLALVKGDYTQLRQAIQAMLIASQKAVIINNATFEASVSNGEVVRWDSGNSRFDEAVADGTSNNRAVGVADVANSKVYLYGECPLFSGLTPGARYYLDGSTAGAITATAPTDAVMVGIAKSATVLWVDIDTATSPASIGYMLVRDEKAMGTSGGASVVGVQTRNLNTVSANTISGASLSSNQVTLPAGTYRICASAPFYSCDVCRAYLYNITDAAVAILGTSEDGLSGTSGRTFVNGRITIPASKVFELRLYLGTAITDGLGKACNQTGNEVYSQVEIIKES